MRNHAGLFYFSQTHVMFPSVIIYNHREDSLLLFSTLNLQVYELLNRKGKRLINISFSFSMFFGYVVSRKLRAC